MIKTFQINLLLLTVLLFSYQFVYGAAPSVQLTVDGQSDNPTVLTSPAVYTIGWNIGNSPLRCQASGNWSGLKAIPNGTETFSYGVGEYAYNLACSGGTTLPEAHVDIIGEADSPKLSPPGINSIASIYAVAVKDNYAFATVYDYITCSAGCQTAGATVDDWDQLVVYDLSNPTSPQLVAQTATGIQPNDILINGDYAYTISNIGLGGDLGVYDISNPLSPTLVNTVDFDHAGKALGMHGGYLYAVGGNSGQDIIAYDITDPSNPVRVGGYDLGNTEGTGYAQGIVFKDNYAYVAVDYMNGPAGNHSRLETFDISNPSNIVRVNTDASLDFTFGSEIEISGNYVYLASGRWIVEAYSIANRQDPILVGSFDVRTPEYPYPYIDSMKLSADNPNYMYVGVANHKSLLTLNIADPANMFVSGFSHASYSRSYISLAFYNQYIIGGKLFPAKELSVIASYSTSTISVSVTDPPEPSGTIVADNCIIPDGEGTCDIAISWSGTNTTAPNSIRREWTTIANNVPENGNILDSIAYGSYTYHFYDSSGSLAFDSASAACEAGSSINGDGLCSSVPQTPQVTIQAEPRLVRSGGSTTVLIDVDSEEMLTCEVYGISDGGSPISFTHTGSVESEQQYEYDTNELTSAQIATVTCSVESFSSVNASDSVLITVLPTFQES